MRHTTKIKAFCPTCREPRLLSATIVKQTGTLVWFCELCRGVHTAKRVEAKTPGLVLPKTVQAVVSRP